MDVAGKLVMVVGGVLVVRGLFWVLDGVSDYSAGSKNNDPQRKDSGVSSMVWGGVMAAISAGVTAAIVAALNNIKF